VNRIAPSIIPALALLSSCGSARPAAAPPAPAAPAAALPRSYSVSTIALPGGNADGVFMDYLLYDPRTHAVWVPAGNTGSVDVVDTTTSKLRRVEGFPTQEMERRGKKRVVGPSSATLGDGVVYVGSRGDFTVCAIDDVALTKRACGTLDAMPDGIAYVARTKEVWVTTPRDKSIRVLDGATLAQKAKLDFAGEPEGFAVDGARGRFYTNLEDQDLTLAIDLDSRKTVATWKPACGEEGPHGLRLAETEGFLFVACSAKAETLDAAHDGAVLGSIDTGDGVDDLDYAPASHRLYVGAARAAKLTIADVDGKGRLSSAAVVSTADGARNGVVDGNGVVYLAHSAGSELVVASPTTLEQAPRSP
jgi:DNA-binding beta-propeller fold protein YncE